MAPAPPPSPAGGSSERVAATRSRTASTSRADCGRRSGLFSSIRSISSESSSGMAGLTSRAGGCRTRQTRFSVSMTLLSKNGEMPARVS